MIIDEIVKPLAFLNYLQVKQKEKQLGYRLVLPHSPQLINGTMIFDMTPVWKRAGIDAEGINYFTIGSIENGLSSRFVTNSPNFQLWFGGYVVKFAENREWTLEDHFQLGVEDQMEWLRLYGDPNPLVEGDFDKVKMLGNIIINGHKGKLYEGGGWSNSDVGNGKKRFIFPLLMAAFGYYLKKTNPKLQVNYKNFMPEWSNKFKIEPYQKVYVHVYAIILEIRPSIKAILYTNGVEFKDKTGKTHDTFKVLKTDLLSLLKKVLIESV